jgi:hypothetical protein
MLEVALAVSVLAAVVLIGVLISIGNERQRRALEELRSDLRQWALGDLEIKREKAVREIQIIDPLAWLRDVTRRVTGEAREFRDVAKILDSPEAIVVTATDGSYLMFSPVRPSQIKKLLGGQGGRNNKTGPLPSMIRLMSRGKGNLQTHELSALNAGIFFDVEADRVWRMFTNRPLNTNQLWLYDFQA